MLRKTALHAGNLLLKVWSRADGSLPEASVEVLRESGAWLRRNEELVRDSTRSPFTCIWDGTGTELCVTDIRNLVRSARFVEGGASVTFDQSGDHLFPLNLPPTLLPSLFTTIVLEVEGKPETTAQQTSFWIPG